MQKKHNLSLAFLSGCLLAAIGCAKYDDTGVNFVRQQQGDLKSCIDDASARTPALRGQKHEIDMSFQIAPDGRVSGIALTKDDVNDPAFAECLKSKTSTWQLPAPPSGKVETFAYKFNAHFQ